MWFVALQYSHLDLLYLRHLNGRFGAEIGLLLVVKKSKAGLLLDQNDVSCVFTSCIHSVNVMYIVNGTSCRRLIVLN